MNLFENKIALGVIGAAIGAVLLLFLVLMVSGRREGHSIAQNPPPATTGPTESAATPMGQPSLSGPVTPRANSGESSSPVRTSLPSTPSGSANGPAWGYLPDPAVAPTWQPKGFSLTHLRHIVSVHSNGSFAAATGLLDDKGNRSGVEVINLQTGASLGLFERVVGFEDDGGSFYAVERGQPAAAVKKGIRQNAVETVVRIDAEGQVLERAAECEEYQRVKVVRGGSVLLQGNNGMKKFRFPNGERVSWSGRTPPTICLSPGGKTALLDCYLVDYATGKTIATIELQSQHFHIISSAAFHRNGRTLALVCHGDEGNHALLVWDLTNGRQTHGIPLKIPDRLCTPAPYYQRMFELSPPGEIAGPKGRFKLQRIGPVDWVADRTVSVAKDGFSYVVDLDKNAVVWRFPFAGTGPHDGIGWYVRPGGTEVVPVSFPSPQVREAIARIPAAIQGGVRAGDTLTIEVKNEAPGAPFGFDGRLRKNLTTVLNDVGYQVASNQPRILRISSRKGAGGEKLEFRKDKPSAFRDLALTNDVLEATFEIIDAQGQRVWSYDFKTSVGVEAGSEFYYKGNPQDFAWKKCWTSLENTPSRLKIPSLIAGSGVANEVPFGESRFTPDEQVIFPVQ